MQPSETIKALHAAYCQETGLHIQLTQQRMFAWDAWITHGAGATPPWGIPQLVAVIQFLQVESRQGDRNKGCLKFNNLIEDFEGFELELAYARKDYLAKQRAAKKPKFVPDKASVCRSAGPVPGYYADAPPDQPARPVGAVIDEVTRQTKFREHMAKLKAAAGMPTDPKISQPAIPPAGTPETNG